MKKIKEYDLAYICYYSERLGLHEIGLGFEPRCSIIRLTNIIQKLKTENRFDYYKKMYLDLLNG
ncbi:hypothetical protein BK708_29225 [Bacillus thuringiensis serovar yunnanensis]|nr:hypothetical protein BK708_29225 [Bacillus thuringiensis serovar yunnanensis]